MRILKIPVISRVSILLLTRLYHVIFNDGRRIVVAPQKMTDDRLVQSKFFQTRKNTWLSCDVMYGQGSYTNKIKDDDFDVQLTLAESAMLKEIIETNSDNIQDHGWYDVNVIECSYDW
jgi:hypothetical protein